MLFPSPFECDQTLWTPFFLQYDIEAVPEPVSWVLIGSGLLGIAARRRSTRPKRTVSDGGFIP